MRQSVPDIYAAQLAEYGVVTHEALVEDAAGYNSMLNEDVKKAESYQPEATHLKSSWSGIVEASVDKITSWDTGIIQCYLHHHR